MVLGCQSTAKEILLRSCRHPTGLRDSTVVGVSPNIPLGAENCNGYDGIGHTLLNRTVLPFSTYANAGLRARFLQVGLQSVSAFVENLWSPPPWHFVPSSHGLLRFAIAQPGD